MGGGKDVFVVGKLEMLICVTGDHSEYQSSNLSSKMGSNMCSHLLYDGNYFQINLSIPFNFIFESKIKK